MKSMVRTPQGEAVIHALYDKHLAATGIQTESRMIPTRFGGTHVLLAAEILPDCPHFIPEQFLPVVNERIEKFLTETI